ncbi:MAG: histidine--tRNA ligase [Clostridia bacterium]|nr:histidine--tRNA ligase [Clostridia bacterium]
MELITKAPRGTADVLPPESEKWNKVIKTVRQVAFDFNLKEVRTPTFEHTELFERGVGGTTDVVQKEMYTFSDKGGRSITLRPEGTASAVRAVLESGLYGGAMPLKLFYEIPCFRYEKPQAGRLREFHQFGVEIFGAKSVAADLEVITLGDTVLKRLGLKNVLLSINSIGCKECRAKYKEALIKYFSDYKDTLCETCLSRLEKNPLRILDCKSEICKSVNKDAPSILDYLCDGCKSDFDELREKLDLIGIDYVVDDRIVRGLDYYNGIVFEFSSKEIGAQSQLLAGGRYDGLASEIGGEELAGLGFGMGIERIIMVMEKQGLFEDISEKKDIFLANMGEKGLDTAAKLVFELRNKGLSAEFDICGKGMKAQLRYADKNGYRYTAVIGDNEIKTNTLRLKNMETGESEEITFDGIYDAVVKGR